MALVIFKSDGHSTPHHRPGATVSGSPVPAIGLASANCETAGGGISTSIAQPLGTVAVISSHNLSGVVIVEPNDLGRKRSASYVHRPAVADANVETPLAQGSLDSELLTRLPKNEVQDVVS